MDTLNQRRFPRSYRRNRRRTVDPPPVRPSSRAGSATYGFHRGLYRFLAPMFHAARRDGGHGFRRGRVGIPPPTLLMSDIFYGRPIGIVAIECWSVHGSLRTLRRICDGSHRFHRRHRRRTVDPPPAPGPSVVAGRIGPSRDSSVWGGLPHRPPFHAARSAALRDAPLACHGRAPCQFSQRPAKPFHAAC